MKCLRVSITLVVLIVGIVAFSSCSGGTLSHTSNSTSSNSIEAVFLGDSSTSQWNLDTYFPGNHYINAGVSGNLSSDMVARFQNDVIRHQPKVVLIWAGENDLNNGISGSSALEDNIIKMRQQAADAGIKVVLCTLPPSANKVEPYTGAMLDLNTWLRSYAASTGTTLADYYNALAAEDGALRPEYVGTNSHLTSAGYTSLAPVAKSALTAAEL
jgi:lysophospholipase L1-like esterase